MGIFQNYTSRSSYNNKILDMYDTKHEPLLSPTPSYNYVIMYPAGLYAIANTKWIL